MTDSNLPSDDRWLSDGPTVLICSYLEPELVDAIQAVDARIRVLYEPDLLRPPRYPSDHLGDRQFQRTDEQEERWRSLLAQADVLFDFDHTNRSELATLAPQVQWIQATSSGIGQFVERMGYARQMPETVFTNAAGVHAQPLAEFAVLSMLAFSRSLLLALDQQARHHWERFAGTDVAGRTVVIFGAGKIGQAVGRTSRAMGMHAIGIKRRVGGTDPVTLGLDEIHPPERFREVLPRADFLVMSAPHTPDTEGVVGAAELALLPAGAVVVNVGRGRLIDEAALIQALESGHLGGAALDVFETEPLPVESPLWDMPNVIVCPHSASTSDRENTRLVELFCDNLRRYLNELPLRNVLDAGALY